MRGAVFFDIDTQYDFMKKTGRLYVNGAEAIIPNLNRLTGFAAKRRIPIISSADAHLKNDPEFKIFSAHCTQGSPGQKKIAQTRLKKYFIIKNKKYSKNSLFRKMRNAPQIVIEKQKLDMFSNPNLKILLKYVRTAYVYGVVTEYCVKAVVEGLLKCKKKVYLITDAIKEVSLTEKNKTLKELKQKGCRFITTDKLIKLISKNT